jgi:predicted nucleic-acid-binding protein
LIGLDTNVLVRFITQDDPTQSAAANAIFEALTEDEPGFVSIVAMVELVWVLERAYDQPGAALAATVERILQSASLVVEDEQEVFAAAMALKEGLGGFADALTGVLNAKAGCRHTLTFDRKALRLPGFRHA